MAACGARAHRHPVADSGRSDVFAVAHNAGSRVDEVENVLVDRLFMRQVLSGLPVQLPEDSVFPHRKQQALAVAIDQDLLEGFVQVERFSGNVLAVPDDGAVVRIDRQGGVGVECCVLNGEAAARGHPRLGLGRPPVDEPEFGIVAAGVPHVDAPAELQRQITPGVAPGLSRTGNREGAPHFLASDGVVRRDKATLFEEAGAPIDAVQYLPLDDDRTGRVGEALVIVGDLSLPHRLPRAGVQRHHVGVPGRDEDVLAVDRQVAELTETTA